MKSILLLLFVLLSAIGIAAQESPKVWNFDADKTSENANGFRNEGGDWKVVADDSAPSKPNALAQLAKSSGSIFNLTLISNTYFKNIDITIKMRAVGGTGDQGGGLVWRAKDAKNYYVMRFNPLEDNFRVYKVVGGQRTELASADLKAPAGWHALQVIMIGDHIKCYVDAQKLLDVHDSTFQEAGQIGLWTKADAQTYFDDLIVKEIKP